MKIQKQKAIEIILMILIILLSGSLVYADSLSVKLAIDSAKLQEDKTYTITASIVEINTLEGIDVITAKLNYDLNIFDKESIDVAATNGWNPIYDEEEGILIIQKGKKSNKNEIFLTIHLKTKENIATNSTSITLSNIVGSGGTGDLELGNATLILDKTIEEPESETEAAIDFEVSTIATANLVENNNLNSSSLQNYSNQGGNSNINLNTSNNSNTRKYKNYNNTK